MAAIRGRKTFCISLCSTAIVLFLIMCFALLSIYLSAIKPVVFTPYGAIEGFEHISSDGNRSEVFLGIPYAKPPVGDLRFEKPQPPDSWKNAIQANEFGPECASYPYLDKSPQSEDCLTLNIIKPKAGSPDPAGYPVMVYVHGGGFQLESGSRYGYKGIAADFVSRGVIVVTLNYRLGFFGFFSLGTNEAPGNYAIWDQIEALRFVQKVISNFGGNPNNVTVFGESAGAAAVSYLTIAPQARDLFQKTIQMSGSGNSIWASGDETIKKSKLILQALDCNTTNNQKECAKKHSTEEIRKVMAPILIHPIQMDSPHITHFNPVFNSDLFPDSATFENAIEKAQKRPHIVGITSQEHASFTAPSKFPNGTLTEKPSEQWSDINNSDLTDVQLKEVMINVLKADTNVPSNAYINSIVNFYETQQKVYRQNKEFQAFIQFFSDFQFNIPALREARSKSASGYPVYFYRFDLQIQQHYVDGAPHASELPLLFSHRPLRNAEGLREAVYKVKYNFIDFFVSFAKSGVPSTTEGYTPEPVTYNKVPFIAFNTNITLNDDLWPERVAFYEKLAKDYGYDLPSGRVVGAKRIARREL